MDNKMALENELLEYLRNDFDHSNSWNTDSICDEPFIDEWKHYIEKSKEEGIFNILKKYLPQLQFPIEKGMSENHYYRLATRKGMSINYDSKSSQLLKSPEELKLYIHDTLAGKIPIIFTPNREDFVALVRALSCRNEPIHIPDSMGACFVKGYNNWNRIWNYKEKWKKSTINNSEEDWQIEFKKIIPKKSLYQDKFIILSNNYYSNIPPEKMGLSNEKWKNMSLIIRREHEATHYFTQRILGSARNNLFDELIADYMGLVEASGKYISDHFILFMGLENYPNINKDGRFQIYVDNKSISENGIKELAFILIEASRNLEVFHWKYWENTYEISKNIKKIMALTRLTLIELASDDFEKKILKWM